VIPADEWAELARRYLAEARQRGVAQLPPSLLMRECAELRRLLGQVLAVLDGRQDDARQLAEVREVLETFATAGDDIEALTVRLLALERIEQIVTGGQQ
jgi:hypothetical protein